MKDKFIMDIKTAKSYQGLVKKIKKAGYKIDSEKVYFYDGDDYEYVRFLISNDKRKLSVRFMHGEDMFDIRRISILK